MSKQANTHKDKHIGEKKQTNKKYKQLNKQTTHKNKKLNKWTNN